MTKAKVAIVKLLKAKRSRVIGTTSNTTFLRASFSRSSLSYASCEYDSFVHLMRFMKQKMLALGDPRLANESAYERQNAKIEEEETAHHAPSGVEETVDDIVVVEGSGMALLNALSSSNNGGNVKK